MVSNDGAHSETRLKSEQNVWELTFPNIWAAISCPNRPTTLPCVRAEIEPRRPRRMPTTNVCFTLAGAGLFGRSDVWKGQFPLATV